MDVAAMGTVRMSQIWMLRWVVLLVGLQLIQGDYGGTEDPMDLTAATAWPTTTAVYPSNHVNRICSMWGNFHFKTFDGEFYQFPGTCEYNLVSDCKSLVHQFLVHVKRTENDNGPKISRVSVSINNIVFELTENQVMVNGKNETLPVHTGGILVEEDTIYIRLRSKMGIAVMWNREDAVTVELDSKYSDHTCGLCGNFNGVPDEFIQSEYKRRVGFIEFGNMQKVLNPMDNCQNPPEENDEINLLNQCENYQVDCADLLEDEDWFSCTEILNPEPYINACMIDMCLYEPEDNDNSSICATLSEYSRQCSHAGGNPPTWRTADFCAVTCPYNMVHSESGSPCMDTCSHKDTNTLCEEHNIDGCFCPPGTVFDEISNKGCIPVEQCSCMHDRVYSPGEVLHKNEEECTCENGNWICVSIPGPGLCAVEEGSHFTTYDGKEFTFHGDCNYVLSKGYERTNFTILAQIHPCFTGTCLRFIEVLFYNDKNNRLVIKDDGTVQHNAKVSLPYMAADFSVFMPSSFHIILQTSFGLELQVQLVPLMQVYITVDQSFQGKTSGLCGNFNKVLSDDLKTPQGVVEGTAVLFANAWKTESDCPDCTERMDDPCSYSTDSEHFAEHWCSKMKDKESLFAKCHTTVNPDSYYKRCKYSICTCEKSEECLCAVFSSYARACAAKGIFLQGWRKIACEKYTENCPASQNYSYQLQSCQRTCLSLASERQSCSVDFVPVDGCACPDGLYQDENGLCVPMEKCPCYHKGETVQPGMSMNINNEHCVCVNGTLHCQSWKTQILECPSPMVFFNCSTAGPDEHGLKCARTCKQKEVDCFSLDCESGCQCPTGLLDDGRGNCVSPHECPCPHDGELYEPGTRITIDNDCNYCTCQQGTWKCTENKCPGICSIYGSGHYKTFDQQRFGFRGDCSYIAAQDKCGNKTGNFHVITENIPCGTTGTTCTKAVVIILGNTTLELSGKTVKVSNTSSGPQINYAKRKIGMYLVIDTDIGLMVLWDRKTTVRIILQPQHMENVCGLCGNFNGNGKDDFTTQGSLQTTNIMEFVDSWKASSTCPDAAPDFDPCIKTPNRVVWAKIQCSIIMEDKFINCSNKVDPKPYYENCVKDSCACNTGGDCECLCTAVAAYAQACNDAGVYVDWRTPEFCPVCCDYYNKKGECTWHYSPFTPCYKTCSNLICNRALPKLEGCYPKCPEDKPIFDEKNQVCVMECGCYVNGIEYKLREKIPTNEICQECICDENGSMQCFQTHDFCTTSSTTTLSTTSTTPTTPTSTEISSTSTTITTLPTTTLTITSTTPATPTSTEIPSTTSTTISTLPTPTISTTSTTPTTPTSTEIPSTTSTTTGTAPTSTFITTSTITSTHTMPDKCKWTEWFNSEPGGATDNETYVNIKENGNVVCEHPEEIECKNVEMDNVSFDDFINDSNQVVQCNISSGLMCKEEEQTHPPYKCFDYKIRVCCVTIITTTTVKVPTTTLTITSTTPTTPTSTEIPSTTSTTTGTTPTSTFTTTSTATTTGTTFRTPIIIVIGNITTTTITPVQEQIGNKTTTPFTTRPMSLSTTPCFCVVQGRQYKPGESILDEHIGSGICRTMSCSLTCAIQNITKLCQLYDCPTWNKTTNETFRISGCTMAKCIMGDIIEIVPDQCPPLKNITCKNNQSKVLVYVDEHHCCQQYACDCFCEGWGDPHYNTFDGLYYTYQGNCTYVLMEEIKPKYHLKIYIDNVYCAINVSCPKSIIVSYNNQVIILRNHRFMGGAALEALKNNVKLTLPYTYNGVRVISSILNLILEIPELQVIVKFGISGFAINLPFKNFGNNTQGHCGTCNNNQDDDCMLPGGNLVKDCAVMADYWTASGVDDKNCTKPSPTPPVWNISTPMPTTPCQNQINPDCDLLRSKLFEACHSHIPPENFFSACQYDSCHMSNATAVCASLQSYASSCSQLGICIHWRNFTRLCKFECPENKIYLPCGPSEPPTCRDEPMQNIISVLTEGCFCPENTKLFNKESGLCVPKCGCIDPSGTPRKLDEHFKYNCEDCVCDKASQSVICKPKKCPDVTPENCTEPGSMLFNVTDPSDPCCSKQVCNVRKCPPLDKKCAVGYMPVLTRDICPEIRCEPKEVCVHDNTEYKPGAKFPSEPCVECDCEMDKDPQTQLHIVKCSPKVCPEDPCLEGLEYVKKGECCGSCTQVACVYEAPNNTRRVLKNGEVDYYTCKTVSCHNINGSFVTETTIRECPSHNCEQGFEYVIKDGECCGECRQVACVYVAPNNTRQTLKEGQEYKVKCMSVTCLKRNGMFMTVTSYKQCPPFNPDDCVPGTEQLDNDGCCKICEPSNCVLVKNVTRLHVDDCTSIGNVEVTSCSGHCDTKSMYSLEKNIMEQSCSCCKHEVTDNHQVMLKCANSTEIPFNYIYVKRCKCTLTNCVDQKTFG